jgi:hypothetical protein
MVTRQFKGKYHCWHCYRSPGRTRVRGRRVFKTHYHYLNRFDASSLGVTTNIGLAAEVWYKVTEKIVKIDKIRINISDADANNYVSDYIIYGNSAGAGTVLYNSPGVTFDSPGQYEEDLAVDCGLYDDVIVRISSVNNAAGNLDINSVVLEGF